MDAGAEKQRVSEVEAGDLKLDSAAQHYEISATAPAGFHPTTPEEKAKNSRVNRKIDIALLPFLSLLYLFSGLDRGNVGNAETQGFTRDIGAVPDDLNFAVSLFFLTFVVFQPFSAAVGRYLGPRIWIPIIMLLWGAVTIAQAFIKGRGALIATRLLIGAFEAGFYPTSVAYLSTFYTRFDLAVRVGIFYGQYAIAGAFSGAIAYGVFQIKNGSLHNWQYLFIIEGVLTCALALAAIVWLPTGPSSAWFLGTEDRTYAVERMRLDSEMYVAHRYVESGIEQDRLTRRDAIETAKDWKLWYVLFFNICASVPNTAFSVFLPLVVQGLGYSSLEANLMSVPPYICGAVGLYLFAVSSDRFRERGYHITIGIFIMIIGLIIMVSVHANGPKYAGLCIFLFGGYIYAPLTVAWLAGNTPEPGKRALVLGVNGWGNLAGVIGSQLYRSEYAPAYNLPFYITFAFVGTALIGYLSYRFTLQAVNKRRLAKLTAATEEDIAEERRNNTRYADKKWTFIYGL
ncbi:MFS general substrate transporter [Thozetella sp. PMI_491]|nr:MFS general substrate transporter [Thozetella sp. PMI_491]